MSTRSDVPIERDDQEDFVESKAKPLQPDWKNPPTVSQLKQDVQDAEPDFHEHVNDVKKWLDLRDARLKIKIPKGQSQIAPKLIRKQNEWRYSSLSEPFLSSEDMFDVKPATHEDTKSAEENAIILNKQFKKDIKRISFIDEYVRTAVDEGTVFVRIGWEFDEFEEEYEEEVVELVPAAQNGQEWQQMQMAVQSGQASPDILFKEVPTGETVTKTKITTLYNRPTLEVCDYNKIMLDPTCNGKIGNARFAVYQFYSSKGELNNDEKYSNIDAIVMSADNPMSYSDDDIIAGSFNFKDDTRKRLLVTEYWGDWDIHNNGTLVPVVATYVGITMIRLEENPFPDKKPPFVKVNYLPKRKNVYGGEPDAVLIEDNQDVIGAVTRGMIDLMGKSANAQQGISADALDVAQKIRFESGKDFVFNPGIDPSKAFYMGKFPEIPQSAPQMIQHQENDAESLTAIKSWSQGVSGDSLGKVAEGVRSANDASAKRELGILRRLAYGMVEIGEKIAAMNAVNLDDEEIVMMTDGEEIHINRDALEGVFDVSISISTPEVDKEQAQDLGFMLQTIGPNMDPGLQSKILGKIARLKKMPDLAHDIETYEPEPNPQEEEIKTLQIELLKAQLANEVAKGQENQADTRLKDAKAITEKAKARSLESSADSEDLEFLQKKDGTGHKQDMEKADQAYDQELGKKAADSLLDKDTPTEAIGSIPELNHLTPINPSSGTQPFEKKDELPGMNTPQENLSSDMVP